MVGQTWWVKLGVGNDKTQHQRWIIRKKKRYGGVKLHSHYAMFCGKPGARIFANSFDGVFPSREEAMAAMPSFIRLFNCGREPSARKLSYDCTSLPDKTVLDVLPNKTVLGVQELDRELTLKRNVAKKIGLIQRRKKLQTAFRDPCVIPYLIHLQIIWWSLLGLTQIRITLQIYLYHFRQLNTS